MDLDCPFLSACMHAKGLELALKTTDKETKKSIVDAAKEGSKCLGVRCMMFQPLSADGKNGPGICKLVR